MKKTKVTDMKRVRITIVSDAWLDNRLPMRNGSAEAAHSRVNKI